MTDNRQLKHLLACCLVTFVLGSVHAFSVFILPLEILLVEGRAAISLIYSAALIMITLAVLFGHHFYYRFSAFVLLLAVALVASAGLWIAALASSWLVFLVGYGLLFGLANGVGYGYTLQLSGQLLSGRSGFAMGTVTASYALGSVVFALLLSELTGRLSVATSLRSLAFLVFAGCLLSAWHFGRSDTHFRGHSEGPLSASKTQARGSELLGLAIAYFCAVFAGLMAIGHAAAIADPMGELGFAAMGAVVVGVGSSIGGVVAGWLIDRYPPKNLLVGFALTSAISLILSASGLSAIMVLISLALIGFAYGAIIAVYPVAIARRYGAAGPQVYGRVFVSWGFAGLSAPWFAGLIFDSFSDYSIALVVAACIAFLSAWFASRLATETA